MRIINTLPQLDAVFPHGRFDMEAWRTYAEGISPMLREMCEADSAEYDFDRDVLPVLDHALAAHVKLAQLAESFAAAEAVLRQNASKLYGCEPDVAVVLYLGLCNAAGWATELDGQPAILLGIEKIIELGWQGETDMKGLIFHELGHLWHEAAGWAEPAEESRRTRAVQQLYGEGIAMRCEQLLCNDDGFYHQDKAGWLCWCEAHAAEIRAEYLRRILRDESTQDFFGDWCSWQGRSDIGYYLGCAFVRWLEREHPLEEIARMPHTAVAESLLNYLAQPEIDRPAR